LNYVALPPGKLIILGPQDSALSEMLLLVWLSIYDVVGEKRRQFCQVVMGFARACVQNHCFTARVELTVSKVEPADGHLSHLD
jgi:hypothetical protein